MPEWGCIEGCQAECCGIFPFPERLFLRVRDNMQVEPIEVVRGNGFSTPVTDDAYCAFLDRKTRRCAIYEIRPRACREYGQVPRLPCPYVNINGAPRTDLESLRMQQVISTSVERKLKIVEKFR